MGLIGIDYKLNFAEGHDIAALHTRNAERLMHLIRTNKGLYIKIGQSLAIQANMLPPPFREGLIRLFDDAPQDSWWECEKTLRTELGVDPSRVFEWVDPEAVASASIAQVHRARLREDGEIVAVKIQHADIAKLTWWDLETYKAMMWLYDRVIFKIPMYFAAKYIADQVRREIDFEVELANAQEMTRLIEGDSYLRKHVHVPHLHPDYSSPRVLVMEWIDGVGLSRKDEVLANGFKVKPALKLVFDMFTKQTFDWGVVHCDPHPGNWILRWHNGRQQLVLLDHGLYIHMSPRLCREYARLWRALFRHDLAEISAITTSWGFGDPKLFASATMMQKYEDAGEGFDKHKKGVDKLRAFLSDTERIPLALIFVGRAQRILQGLNRSYGAPVNRVRILIDGALLSPTPDHIKSWLGRLGEWMWRRFLLAISDAVFAVLQVRQLISRENPEDVFDHSLQETAEELV